MTPRRRDAASTRESILSAAMSAFTERGYRAVTVRDVARDAGVDPALVVRYFGGKAGLFAAGLAATADDDLARILTGPLEDVPAALGAHLAAKRDADAFAMLVLSADDADGRRSLAGLAEDALEGPLVALLTAAGRAPEDARRRARAVTMVMVGSALVTAAMGDPPGAGELERALHAALLG